MKRVAEMKIRLYIMEMLSDVADKNYFQENG
jgi:hypothetical protein